jgi:putative flavoprotein involved in K+ transport
MARRTDVLVIGGGHSGLVMSQALSRRGIDHAVLERGTVANSWRTERWDSLQLLTPNWMARLPGEDEPPDPHGFMRAGELAARLSTYAARIAAPLHTGTTVLRVAAAAGGYRVATDRGDWHARALVLASGAFSRPALPPIAAALPAGIHQLHALHYRAPGQLPEGGVLVVGASATGLQLSQEIQLSGRPVTLAVGEHVRLPRRYRGRDIQWWMHAAGVLDQRIEQMDEPARARRLPSPQLIGSDAPATLDLNTLRAQGVRLAGRLMGLRDGQALFSGSLCNTCALADLKMNRLLDLLDRWAVGRGLSDEMEAPQRFAPTGLDASPLLTMDLAREVRSVVWATGARPDHSWLDLPVFDARGALRHDRGVVQGTTAMVALGLPFMRRRKSSFIHGAADDVRELLPHLVDGLCVRPRRGVAGLTG